MIRTALRARFLQINFIFFLQKYLKVSSTRVRIRQVIYQVLIRLEIILTLVNSLVINIAFLFFCQ